MKTGLFKPYHKNNSQIKYVNRGSNHPRAVLDNIPYGVNKRLSTISSNQECFNAEKGYFQEALGEAGYNHQLNFGYKSFKKAVKSKAYNRQFKQQTSEQNDNITKKKGRDIIYFNPPFNLYCATNVGEEFRKIVEKHFNKGDDLSKLFNRNKLKITYSCLPNIEAKIISHNKHLISKQKATNIEVKNCNCQKSKICPLDGFCNASNIIYKAELLFKDQQEGQGHVYVGLAGDFKMRFRNHEQSFKDQRKRNQSELSKFIWKQKDRGMVEFTLNWAVISKEAPFNRVTKRCQLCTKEKVEILRIIHEKGAKALNKKDEVFRKCLHRFKHYLGSIPSDTHQSLPDNEAKDANSQKALEMNEANDNRQSDRAEGPDNSHEIPQSHHAMNKDKAANPAFSMQNSEQNISISSQRNNADITWGSTRSGLAWRQSKGRKGVG